MTFLQKTLGLLGLVLLISAGCQKKEDRKDSIPAIPQENEYSENVRLNSLTDQINKDPNNPENYYKRALLQLELDNHKSAFKDIERAIALDSNAAKYYLPLAKSYLKHDVNKALDAALKAERKGLATPELFVTIGQIQLAAKSYPQSLEYLDKALRSAENYAPAYLYKGFLYFETGDTAKAISNLQTAIEQSPDLIDAYNKLANIYTNKKQFGLAKEYLQSAIRFNAKDAFVYINLGDLFVAQKKGDSAEVYFKKAQFYAPQVYIPHLKLGQLYFNRGDVELAIEPLKEATKYTQVDAAPHYLLGLVCMRLQKYDEAITNFQQVIMINNTYVNEAEEGIKSARAERAAKLSASTN